LTTQPNELEAIAGGNAVRTTDGSILDPDGIEDYIAGLTDEQTAAFLAYCDDNGYEHADLTDDEKVDVMVNCFDAETIDMREYFDDPLDVNYTCDREKKYMGVDICVAFGGPGIWVNTNDRKVLGAWGCDRVEICFSLQACEAIDEVFEDFFNL